MKFFTLSLLVGLAAAAASATAAPVAYNITFTETSGGTAPTSGSFLYDSATETFSSFIIEWNARSFDLTSSANSPAVSGPCNTAAANSADFFTYLAGATPCASRVWNASEVATTFSFRSFSLGGGRFPIASATSPDGLIDASGRGAFSVSLAGAATEVPEPSSWVLMLSGGTLVAWRRRRDLARQWSALMANTRGKA